MTAALVIGASGGIGSALVAELRKRGYDATPLSRRDDGFDITDPTSVDTALGGLGPFEIVMLATGKLDGAGHGPEKSLKALTAEAMRDQFATNALGPALVLKHLPRLLPRDGDGFCGVLSARVGSIGDNNLGGWYAYRAAKAALNQMVHGAAIELGRTHRHARLLALHPGTVATPFTAGYGGRDKLEPPEAARHLLDVLTSKSPSQSGSFWDWKGNEVPW